MFEESVLEKVRWGACLGMEMSPEKLPEKEVSCFPKQKLGGKSKKNWEELKFKKCTMPILAVAALVTAVISIVVALERDNTANKQ